jgi:flagellin
VAADGPADLIISEGLRAQISGLRAAIRNSQEAANYIGIAEGALQEVNDLLSGARALAVHAANTGVVTTEQIAADQSELENILTTIQRINDVTRFAGESVFKAAASATRRFHIGEGGTANDQVTVAFSNIAVNTLGLGTLSTAGASLGANALAAIGLLSNAALEVASLRGQLGAFQKNTLQTNINSLSVALENVTATESYIRDTNMAEETSNYTKNQILVQAGVSVLAQSNVASQSVLQLLG